MQHLDENVYYEYKPLYEYKESWAWGFTLRHGRATKYLLQLLWSAWQNFFIIQTKRKLGITKTPIVNVENEATDNLIPFEKSRVKTYLDFVNFFVRTVSLVTRTTGGMAHKNTCHLLTLIKKLYEMAATIYRQVLSTTKRGHYKGNLRFLIIHMFDPHYLCVPSLHVAIVLGCYLTIRNLVRAGEISDNGVILSQVRAAAVKITESVLFIKQHSVNCVAASLYMMSASGVAGDFSIDEVASFIDDLFLIGCGELKKSVKDRVRAYIFEMYGKFMAANKNASQWQLPILLFLHNRGKVQKLTSQQLK